jgi:hypothetical protein
MGMPVGPSSPEQAAQWAAVNQAQSPQELLAAAQRAGLTGDAQGLAAAGAAPVSAPSFDEQLLAANQRNAALEAQIERLNGQFTAAIQGLQSQMQGVIASVPQKVDPVTESAGKIAAHFAGLPSSDAKNGLHSALVAHLTALGLSELAKILV